MRLNIKHILAFFILPLALAVFIVFHFSGNRKETPAPGSELTKEEIAWINETRAWILHNYVKDVDPRELTYSALWGMVSSLDDYSTFYEEELGFEEKSQGIYEGIGAFMDFDDGVKVRYPFPGSPAEKAGLGPGDRVLEINGTSTEGMDFDQASRLLRGPRGTSCTLLVADAKTGDRRTVEVVRDRIKEESVFLDHMIDKDAEIGYLRVSSFIKKTCGDLEKAVQGLSAKGAKSLVIDLRFNYGGLLEEAIQAANLFIGNGILLRTRGRAQKANHVFMASPDRLRFPRITLVLLVNGSTVRSAEAFAGTLQDRKRAVLVGSRTFGKGVVQTAVRKNFGKEVVIKITTARYYTPLGRCIEQSIGNENGALSGIEPDFTIPMKPRDERKLETFLEKREIPSPYLDAVLGKEATKTVPDVQLDAALKLLKGEPVFSPLRKQGADR